jgi:Ca2+/Na+ antiporter
MEFLYALGGVIALLLGTDSAIKGLSGAVQQAKGSPLMAGVVLVLLAYALPGLAIVMGVWAWQGTAMATQAAWGGAIGALGLGAGGLLLATGVVLRFPWWRWVLLIGAALLAVLALLAPPLVAALCAAILLLAWSVSVALTVRSADERAKQELVEFSATRPGWGLNLFRLGFGAALLLLGARGVWAASVSIGAWQGLDASAMQIAFFALSSGFVVAVVANFNARFGDAAPALAASVGAGVALACVALLLSANSAVDSTRSFMQLALQQPALVFLGLAAALVLLARPEKALTRREGLVLVVLCAALLCLPALLR